MKKQIIIEMNDENATEFINALTEKKVKYEGPDEIDSLDGTSLVSLIIQITPIVLPFIIELVKTLKGNKGRIVSDGKVIYLENLSIEQLEAILQSNK